MDKEQKGTIVPIFSTPLYCCSLENVNIPEVCQHMTTLEFGRIPGEPGGLTRTMQILDDEKLAQLSLEVRVHVKRYIKDILEMSGEWFIHTSWGVMQSPGEKCSRHNHPNSLFSGIVYLHTTENTGVSQFFHPRGGILPPTVAPELDQSNVFNAPIWELTPPVGGICMFPSYLDHAVGVNEDEVDRLSIAFNVWFRGRIGNETSHLELL